MPVVGSNRPIATCKSESCEDCSVGTGVNCHFSLAQLIQFLLVAMPAFLVGGYGIYLYIATGATGGGLVRWWPLGVWIAIQAGYFYFLEIRVMCSHCPHYSEQGARLQCWANYGAPKLWKYRPGPMSTGEKALFLGGLAVIWACPIPFFVLVSGWYLLLVYLVVSASFFTTLKTVFCSRCMNFACPLNGVKKEVRGAFFAQNPVVAEAWGVGGKGCRNGGRQGA